jgi:hypothetical protein
MERVELTIRHRGPAIRAEAAADDRYTALDLALAKLEARLRRVNDRRADHGVDHATARPRPAAGAVAVPPGPAAGGRGDSATPAAPLAAAAPAPGSGPEDSGPAGQPDHAEPARPDAGSAGNVGKAGRLVPIEMDGDGPLVVREKFHRARPMSIDQALFEMELVGHDFFLFRDSGCGQASVVYRRRGYDYGVIRLVEG